MIDKDKDKIAVDETPIEPLPEDRAIMEDKIDSDVLEKTREDFDLEDDIIH